MSELIRIDEVAETLVRLGVVDAKAKIEVQRLEGGVSSSVFKATIGDRSIVLKQALPQLRVAGEWLSDPSRSRIEYEAAAYLSKILPGYVPGVLARDAHRNLFVMEGVKNQGTWKEQMLGRTFDPDLGAMAGALLGNIHEISRLDPELPETFGDKRFFRELRIDAYIQEVGRVHPLLATAAEKWTERLSNGRFCLVHADFSPKNLLVTQNKHLVLLDHEVAHWGDPAFDLAFFLTHILAKSMRSDKAFDVLRSTLKEYQEVSPTAWNVVQESGELLGLVMMARVDGKSPLEYLTIPEQMRLRKAAIHFIQSSPVSLAEAPELMQSVPR